MSTPVPDEPTTGPTTDPTAAATTEARIRLENAALVRRGTIPVVAIGLLLVLVWSLIDGWDGFLGALVGLLMVGVFYGSDIYLMRKTRDLVPMAVFAVMAMAFTLKLTVLAVFLVALKDTTAFSVPAFATTVIVLTSVGLLVAVWLSARTTTLIEPAAGDEADGPS